MNKAGYHLRIGVAIFFVLILMGAGTWFALDNRTTTPVVVNEEQTESEVFEISNLELCTSLPENTCIQNLGAEYYAGEDIFLSFDIRGLSIVDSFVEYSQDFELFDHRGELISEGSTYGISSKRISVSGVSSPIIGVTNALTSHDDDPLGYYLIRVTVHDQNSGESLKGEVIFRLK